MTGRHASERGEQVTMPYVSPTILETIVRQSALPILVSFQTRWVEVTVPGLRESVESCAGVVQVVQVGVTAYPHIAERFNIRVIPTRVIFQCGATPATDPGETFC